jgi:hypothetical protein
VKDYISRIAEKIYRTVEGRNAPPIPLTDLPLYRTYAVLARAKGRETTLEDVHDAWSAWMAGIMSDHRSLIPFAELTREVQEMDRPYMQAIHDVVRELEQQAA